MSPILFDSAVFGPVKSRRLGISLGINLLPVNCKLCNYNCIYCECGLTGKVPGTSVLPSRKEIREKLENKLGEMMFGESPLDTITFAGNGEPTLHPEFGPIVSDVLFLRQAYFPSVKVAVLTNGTMIHKKEIAEALQKVDMNIIKIDSAIEETYLTLNRPSAADSLEELVARIKKFPGKFIIQTMFVQGTFNGIEVDNTTEYEVEKWVELLQSLRPQMVMIYTIDRKPAEKGITKVPESKLHEIATMAKKAGIKTMIAG